MNLRSERTRATLLDAALNAFAQRGIRATTLEDIALAAKVTRGAVYWHFADKLAIVREVFNDMVWPFDVGSDIELFRRSGNPLHTLRDVLWLRLKNCLDDTAQRNMIELLIKSRGAPDLPDDVSQRLEQLTTQSIQSLTAVLNISYMRHGLRRGLTPVDVATGIHATGLGVLAENTSQLVRKLSPTFFLPLELVLLGASADPRKERTLFPMRVAGQLNLKQKELSR
ncbi:TetR/AcrR family acrAB operon transcriptional repressor [Herbaspirillum sp. Sphag1AN]|uniref:TetR family transcriptional regulator n=1 Tax=unclassified Herbaspirillum TaxID=2624150 RepID=UPI00160DF25B|nr:MULTISPECIES: TetR family transcriptional regulator [unclassified Herbaspirillum]MBB3213873.1 TetR/AcrR family acrAB operon transcriptional repressor [Herbaspirillum sp. Sphag1AN]MBB3247070.1 TetR/AcrR family acrAB operon transcriptional repressor [Herbaspirillum sp. Sphag64]